MKKKLVTVALLGLAVTMTLGLQNVVWGDTSTASAGNLVRNGEFDKNMIGWTVQVHDTHGANARISIGKEEGMSGNKAARIAIKSPGTQNWEIELFNTFALKKDKTYQISFLAKAGAASTIGIMLQQNVSPWQPYTQQTFNITTEPETYTFSWKSEVTDPETRINFNFGTCDTDVWLDNVQVIQMD